MINLREAIDAVRGADPSAIEAIDAEAEATRKAAEAAAKKQAKAEARVAAEAPALAAKLKELRDAEQAEAEAAADLEHAGRILRQQYGLVSDAMMQRSAAPMRTPDRNIAAHLARIRRRATEWSAAAMRPVTEARQEAAAAEAARVKGEGPDGPPVAWS